MVWVKPQVLHSKYYPEGFFMEIAALGARFNPPPKGNNVLNLDGGSWF
jgi:hypothetical protein